MIERRAIPRQIYARPARLVRNDGSEAVTGTVVNGSAHGVGILLHREWRVPANVALFITGEDRPYRCALRWQSGQRVGLEFQRAKSVQPLENRIREELTDWRDRVDTRSALQDRLGG